MSFETILIIIIVGVVAAGVIPIALGSRRQAVEDYLKNLGYEVISIDRKDFYTYHAEVRAKHTPGVFIAVLTFPMHHHRDQRFGYTKGQEYDTLCITDWIGDSPIEKRLFERALDEAPAYEPQDPQERINLEISRRLDAITNTPGGLLRYDLNQNGQIEPEEWEALRARVRAEVEAELGASAQPAPAQHTHEQHQLEQPSPPQGSSW